MFGKFLASSIDLAKVSLAPLVLGFFTAALYYSQFRVPSLALVTPQCIIVGLYVLILYLVLPVSVKSSLTKWHGKNNVIVWCVMLFIINSLVIYFCSYNIWIMLTGSVVALLMQLLVSSSFKMVNNHDMNQVIVSNTPPGDVVPEFISLRLIIFLLMCCFHFATFVYPSIPYYFAGGKPIQVRVIPKSESKAVLDDITFDRKDKPMTNPDLPTFDMTLLYETSDDYYFISQRRGSITVGERTVQNVLLGNLVTRVRREHIARMDYSTPITLDLKEIFK